MFVKCPPLAGIFLGVGNIAMSTVDKVSANVSVFSHK